MTRASKALSKQKPRSDRWSNPAHLSGGCKRLSGLLFSSVTSVLYSLTGIVLSIVTMSLLKKFFYDKYISVVGISIAGSAMFNIGQVIMACIFTKSFKCVFLLSYMLPLSVVTGIATGIIVHLLLNKIKRGI